MISPAVLVDGEEKFLIHNSGYSFFYLKPGPHIFTLKLSDRYKGLAQIEVVTEANRTYYVKVLTELKGIFLIARRYFRITVVADEIAREEIKECGYLDPAQSKKFSKSYLLEDN